MIVLELDQYFIQNKEDCPEYERYGECDCDI